MMSEPEHLAVGRVLRPHGVRGDLLVDPYSETIRSIESQSEVYLGSTEIAYTVVSLRSHRDQMILHVDGCDDRDAAERFRGAEVALPKQAAEPLPEGVYYRWQILGLSVVDDSGEHLGTVSDIIETGANDVYVVDRDRSKELLLPAIESVILEVDLEAGRLLVRLLEGLE